MYRQSEKNLLSSNISSRCPHNMVNFGLLAAEIDPAVWGTPANFNGFRVLAALVHGSRSQVVSVSQTLRRWTESPTYVRQGNHQVGHWHTFQCYNIFQFIGTRQILPRYIVFFQYHAKWLAGQKLSKMIYSYSESNVNLNSINYKPASEFLNITLTSHMEGCTGFQIRFRPV